MTGSDQLPLASAMTAVPFTVSWVPGSVVPATVKAGLSTMAPSIPALTKIGGGVVSASTVLDVVDSTLVVAAESVSQHRAGSTRLALIYAALAGWLAACAFLTRSIGVALIVAVLAWFLKERMSKPLLLAGACILLLVAPWQLYARRHTPSPELQREQQGYITQNYVTQFWQRSAGEDENTTIQLSNLPARVGNNLGNIIGQQFGLLYVSRLMLILGEIGLGLVSVLLSALALVGLVNRWRQDLTTVEIYVTLSLGFILFWPWDPMRFLLPLTPLLLYYALQGGQTLWAWWQRDKAGNAPASQWVIATAVVTLMVALNLISNFEFIGSLNAQGRRNAGELGEFTEIETMMNWVKENVAENETCASLNPGLVYLYTNRKTVSAQDPLGNWEYWKKWGVRYLVLTKPYGVPERDAAGKPIRVAYQSKRAPMLRVIDLGSASERAPWPASIK